MKKLSLVLCVLLGTSHGRKAHRKTIDAEEIRFLLGAMDLSKFLAGKAGPPSTDALDRKWLIERLKNESKFSESTIEEFSKQMNELVIEPPKSNDPDSVSLPDANEDLFDLSDGAADMLDPTVPQDKTAGENDGGGGQNNQESSPTIESFQKPRKPKKTGGLGKKTKSQTEQQSEERPTPVTGGRDPVPTTVSSSLAIDPIQEQIPEFPVSTELPLGERLGDPSVVDNKSIESKSEPESSIHSVKSEDDYEEGSESIGGSEEVSGLVGNTDSSPLSYTADESSKSIEPVQFKRMDEDFFDKYEEELASEALEKSKLGSPPMVFVGDKPLESVLPVKMPEKRLPIIPSQVKTLTPEDAKRMTADQQVRYIQRMSTLRDYAIDPNPGRMGFVNLGNTCYLNSVLQLLGHTMSFVNLLKGLRESVEEQSFLGKVVQIIVDRMWEENPDGEAYMISNDGKKRVKPQFMPIDTTELFFALRKDHENESEELGVRADAVQNALQIILNDIKNILDEEQFDAMFTIPTKSHTGCMHCGNIRTRVQPKEQILILPIPENVGSNKNKPYSLKEAFEERAKSYACETCETADACTICKKHDFRAKWLVAPEEGVKYGPKILFIQIARKDIMDPKTKKLLKPLPFISYPETFNLQDMAGVKNLVGHYRTTGGLYMHPELKHYISTFWDPYYREWMVGNDMKVRLTPDGAFVGTYDKIYALVYERQDDTNSPADIK